MKRALTGIRATGDVHIGNYLGAIKPGLALQKEYECFYFIADLHALTTNRDPKVLDEQAIQVAAIWMALGLDTEKHYLYRQSDLPMATEFAWYLSCVTGVGFLEKGHSYKDFRAKNKEPNHGVLAYPVLMAADILMYDSDVVPVGKDQKQHVEMARDMAGSFNAIYGDDIIKLPEVQIREEVMLVPGLDGRKMSKSYDNGLPLFAPEKKLRKKVMGITTDSTPMEEPKELRGSLLGEFVELFATPEQYSDLEKRLQAGGLGWGHAKEELFELINAEVKESRERYEALVAEKTPVKETLRNGAEKAGKIGKEVLGRVREAVGLPRYAVGAS